MCAKQKILISNGNNTFSLANNAMHFEMCNGEKVRAVPVCPPSMKKRLHGSGRPMCRPLMYSVIALQTQNH